MEIDLEAAARFLAALAPDNDWTFQTFDDKKRSRGLARVLHGSLTRHATTLSSLNLKGAGVFAMVNRGDGQGRRADNVIACRALFVDLDGAPLEPVMDGPIRPRIVVESSPGKWHAYWPIADLPPGQFSQAQRALAGRFNADQSVSDKPRVMRVPGFWHNKANPFRSRLLNADPGLLTWDEMARAFGLTSAMRLPNVIPVGGRNATLYRLAATARRAGVPKGEQLSKALQVNASRCAEPLSAAEVAQVVDSAYSGIDESLRWSPTALWESPQFQALDSAGRVLILAAYARANGYNGGCVTLPWSELSPLFPRSKTFYAIRTKVIRSGLLRIIQEPKKRMPRAGRGPSPTVYQLTIGPFLAPYCQDQIGVITAPPEVLQALAPVALDRASDAGGPERSAA